MSITIFREEVVKGLLKINDIPERAEIIIKHILIETASRQICSHCYKKKVTDCELDRKKAKNLSKHT